MVQLARESNIYPGKKMELRPEHYKGQNPLAYPLKSTATAIDSVFIVKEFHSLIKSDISTTLPKGYLIPKADSLLVAFIQRNHFTIKPLPEKCRIFQYFVVSTDTIEIEEYPCPDLMVTKTEIKNVQIQNYHYIEISPTKGLVLALGLEPQSSAGLVNYSRFEYLLKEKMAYPVLRVE